MCVDISHYLFNQYKANGRQYPYLDCYGLICYVYKRELNIDLDLATEFDYKTMTSGYERVKTMFEEVKTEPKTFDIVCFFKHNVLCHVGIYIDDHILESSRKKGMSFTKFIKKPYHRLYRLKVTI